MPKLVHNDIRNVLQFLHIPTPDAWTEMAIQQLPILLVDHAHCERKAATTALNFMSKYSRESALLEVMSPLAREELLHFEKVLTLLKERGIPFGPLKLSYYAKRLHQEVSKQDYRLHLSDSLIVGAIIEARSCERFHALVPWLKDKALAKFYALLVKAEARHFEDYLRLAQRYRSEPIAPRVHQLLSIERELIESHDPLFRLHGGIPSLQPITVNENRPN
ncbi:MAG TPA: tRNA hydroxylase [Legionella sp.]|nr:tRNA hydroxylase [Legionella sp.]